MVYTSSLLYLRFTGMHIDIEQRLRITYGMVFFLLAEISWMGYINLNRNILDRLAALKKE
jgi:hypothetical protein